MKRIWFLLSLVLGLISFVAGFQVHHQNGPKSLLTAVKSRGRNRPSEDPRMLQVQSGVRNQRLPPFSPMHPKLRNQVALNFQGQALPPKGPIELNKIFRQNGNVKNGNMGHYKSKTSKNLHPKQISNLPHNKLRRKGLGINRHKSNRLKQPNFQNSRNLKKNSFLRMPKFPRMPKKNKVNSDFAPRPHHEEDMWSKHKEYVIKEDEIVDEKEDDWDDSIQNTSNDDAIENLGKFMRNSLEDDSDESIESTVTENFEDSEEYDESYDGELHDSDETHGSDEVHPNSAELNSVYFCDSTVLH